MDFWRFAEPAAAAGPPLDGAFSPLLVILSVCLSSLAGITALLIADRIEASRIRSIRRSWLLAGAVAMGTGIWSMHFTGMLAFTLPVHMNYDLATTLVSLVPAMLGSGAALYFLTVARLKLWGLKLQVGALLMALGIGTMHYTGMEAMRMPADLRYDFLYFVLSIVVAHILAMIAIYTRSVLHHISGLPSVVAPLIGGVVMGHAVAGMHYTAMYAASFYPLAHTQYAVGGLSHAAMASTIAVFSILILVLTILATWIDTFRQMLKWQARTDSMTGLPNRESLTEYLNEALRYSRTKGRAITLAYLGLDDFKGINNSLGHIAGDEVLKIIASRLRGALPGNSFLSRYSGDQFAIALDDRYQEQDEITPVVEELLNTVQQPLEVSGIMLHLRASVGISISRGGNTDTATLIRQADNAMHVAKQESQGVCFFSTELEERAREQLWISTELRSALDQGRLELHYQPQVELLSGRLVCLEALVRWKHSVHGWITPGRFIPVAQGMGLSLKLDSFVLERACRQGRKWLDDGFNFGYIAVNLSSEYLEEPDAIDNLTAILGRTGLPANLLQIEITESRLIALGFALRKRLLSMQQMGLSLAIDDFGTGYSSLSYLKDLPVDKLKLDQSFVKTLSDNSRTHAIPDAVVGMARGLGLSLVAEGVETEQQRQLLMSLGYQFGQGFLFSPAMPASQVPAFRYVPETLRSA